MAKHGWEPATGQLIDVRYGGKHGDWSGNDAVSGNSVHYLMEVQPDSGGEPFRCECAPPALMLSFRSPPFGKPVRMECIPAEHKARFDRHDPIINRKAAQATQRARYESELHPPKGDRFA